MTDDIKEWIKFLDFRIQVCKSTGYEEKNAGVFSEIIDFLLKKEETLLIETKESIRKGEELCQVHGVTLIKMHDLENEIAELKEKMAALPSVEELEKIIEKTKWNYNAKILNGELTNMASRNYAEAIRERLERGVK